MKRLPVLLPLVLIAAGLVLVGVALPGPAGAAPPVLPPRPTLTPGAPVTPPTARPTGRPDISVPTVTPGQPTLAPTAPPVLPAAGVAAPAWPWLLLGVGLVIVGLVVAGRRR